MISYTEDKLEAIWQQYKRVVGIFWLHVLRNGYLGASGQKSDVDFL